ncbi:MAG: response regulator transcription factor [Myxococcota bacterium]
MAPPTAPVRVVVVEDDRRYRASLQTLFEAEPAFALAGVFEDPIALLDLAEAHRDRGERPPWDLVVMDIDLPQLSGIEAGRRLKAAVPGLALVHLTVFDEPATILAAICAGADGYLLKHTRPDELIEQLLAVTHGGSPLTPGVARTLLELVRSRELPAAKVAIPLGLSDRELAVLQGLARGLVCKQIADAHGLSLHTVRTYVRRIYEKLQVATIAEAVAVATRSGLV